MPFPQRLSHAPQFALSVVSSTQPSPHAAWPVGQTHFPATQVCKPAHALPHPPQLAGSLSTSTQVPLQETDPSQAAGPPASGGVGTHMPLEHVSPAGQRLLQDPQLFGSLVRSTHAPPQLTAGAVHAAAHAPLLQTSLVGHVVPHPPQLFGLDATSVHCPLQMVGF